MSDVKQCEHVLDDHAVRLAVLAGDCPRCLKERIAALEAEVKRLLPSSLALENQMLRNTCQSLKDQLDEIGTATGASQAKEIAALEAIIHDGLDDHWKTYPENAAQLRAVGLGKVLGDE